MGLDRKNAPSVIDANSFSYLKAETKVLDNGIPLHFISNPEQDVIRLQFTFKAGQVFQKTPLLASSVVNLLKGGTEKYNSKQLSELIENEGAFLETDCSTDTSCISIYCLVSALKSILPLLNEMLFKASFPETEIKTHLTNKLQKFQVNSQKVSFLAKNNFLEFILGGSNPYNNKIESADFNEINREDLIEFYDQHYKQGHYEIYAAGKVDSKTISLINDLFGKKNWQGKKNKGDDLNFGITANDEKVLEIEKAGAVQSAIRIGKPIIGKSHPDFPALYFVNTLLGGYFGSRLMSNIREDKGYTYGIGSGLISYKDISYFLISTEVGHEVRDNTLREIFKELSNLRKEFVEEKEIELVRNYLRGSLMRSFDGTFAALDRFRNINLLNLDYSYYDELIQEFNLINKEKIKEIANIYFQPDSLKQIIVGNFSN